MKYPNDAPMYFRLPETLKEDFDHICRADRMTMTSTLNTFIRGFVEAKREENPSVYNRTHGRPSKWSVVRR